MPLPVYLAMTAAQFRQPEKFPSHPAWMACHFSCYGTGLSNCPEQLPENTLLILNDRTPVWNHDPELIVAQLREIAERNHSPGVLLDFQRQDVPATAEIARCIVESLDCPVAVADGYAADLICPVFLPPLPLHTTLQAYLAPWQGREVWLDIALNCQQMCVTEAGCQTSYPCSADHLDSDFLDEKLFCRYRSKTSEDKILFTLYRTPETLKALLAEAENTGVTTAVGLFQELENVFI